MWYERFADESRHFVTNCNEHVEWCDANQTACIAHLPTWFNECIAVNVSYLNSLHFTQGDNFTCSEEPPPRPQPPSPPSPGGGKLFAESSFALARTEIDLTEAPVRAVVFVTAEPYTPMPYGRGDVVHAKRLLGQ